MGEHPSVSIAVPVYNGERYVDGAIRSALQQSVPVEVLVFDNASTDATAAIARHLLPSGAVRIAQQNLGAVENFNRAVAGSAGDFFAWLADDDRFEPRFVEACLAELEANPDRPACLTGIRFIDPEDAFLREQTDPDLAATDPAVRLRSYLRRTRWTETYCLYRRKALEESPRFTSEYASDVLLAWWFLLRGPLAVVEEPLLKYREYPTKTVGEMTEALMPGGGVVHWRKVRMWGRLWTITGEPAVAGRARVVARRELVLWLLTSAWWGHLREDVSLRLSHARNSRDRGMFELGLAVLAVPHDWLARIRDRRAHSERTDESLAAEAAQLKRLRSRSGGDI